jgi:hypothetical protein
MKLVGGEAQVEGRPILVREPMGVVVVIGALWGPPWEGCTTKNLMLQVGGGEAEAVAAAVESEQVEPVPCLPSAG